MDPDIGRITRSLQGRRQRATYDAVAQLLGCETRGFMEGEERNYQNSWVVAVKNGLPNKYQQHEIDPALLVAREAGEDVIDNSRDLQAWLDQDLGTFD